MTNWLGKKKHAGWTVVDFGQDGLCGVSVQAPKSHGGKPVVLKCGGVPGSELNPEMLQAMAKKIGVPGYSWIYLLNHKEYNLLVIPEPAVQAEEMEESVRWSVSTLIDYPVSDANVSWMKIPTVKAAPNRAAHLYAMVAQSEVVGWYERLFQQVKLPLEVVDLHETAQRNISTLFEKPAEGLGLLKVGRRGVQFTITHEGELYLDRFVEENLFTSPALGAEALGRATERIVLQVQRSVDFMRRNLQFIDIGRVLVAPTPADIGIAEALTPQLEMPVEKIDLADVFDFTQAPELARPESQAMYFFALGGALRFAE